MSTNSTLTERRSSRSGVSQTLSWSIIEQNQQAVGAPMNTSSMEVSDGPRPIKRSDQRSTRSPISSKSGRRNSETRGSDLPLTAEQRLDQMILEASRGNAAGVIDQN